MGEPGARDGEGRRGLPFPQVVRKDLVGSSSDKHRTTAATLSCGPSAVLPRVADVCRRYGWHSLFPEPPPDLPTEYSTQPVWLRGPLQAAVTDRSNVACERKAICHPFQSPQGTPVLAVRLLHSYAKCSRTSRSFCLLPPPSHTSPNCSFTPESPLSCCWRWDLGPGEYVAGNSTGHRPRQLSPASKLQAQPRHGRLSSSAL